MARKAVKAGIDPTAVGTATKMGVVITPDQIAASGSEHAHQCALFQWIALEGRLVWVDLNMLFAIPNGGDRSMSVAAGLKAEGVKAGVPDMFLPVAIKYYGLWIELKVPGVFNKKDGGRGPFQVEWHKRLRERGYAVVTAYGWRGAVKALRLYYEGALEMPADGDALPVVE